MVLAWAGVGAGPGCWLLVLRFVAAGCLVGIGREKALELKGIFGPTPTSNQIIKVLDSPRL